MPTNELCHTCYEPSCTTRHTSPFRLVRGRYAHVQGFYLDDKRDSGMRAVLRRRTAGGKLTHEIRVKRLDDAKRLARETFDLTFPQTCELRAGKTVKVRGATLRITRR